MQYSVERDDGRDGVWVCCEAPLGPDVFSVRCFVADDDDLTQHAAAVARACERIGPALEAALAELSPR